MTLQWNATEPIYRQIRNLVVERIVDRSVAEGEVLPSLRAVAAEYRVNHLTVMKAYQELVDEGVVESRRGLGMFVTTGAREALVTRERARFLENEWPAIQARIERLGLDVRGLLVATVPPAAASRIRRAAS